MAFAPKASQTLMTPEPHYIPGYSGHCPHYRFTLGRTYGKVTSQLLMCSQANCPGRRLLLQPNSCPQDGEGRPEGVEEQEQEQEEEGDRCSRGKPLPLLGHQAIPGYTGFVPRAQNHFAKTYSEICKDSWSEFARQLARNTGRKQRRAAPRGASSREPKLLTAKHKMPLAAVPPRGSHCAYKPQGSPHSPQKDFISGFTGFVPRAQYLIGASYPVITRRALLEFERMRCKAGQGAPEGGTAEALASVAKTYPTDTGLLPHYKGYVPGYKFRFGHTFGRLTHNALGQGPAEKQMAELLPLV